MTRCAVRTAGDHVIGQLVMRLTPARSAARFMRSASESDAAIGFSVSMCAPCAAIASATSPCFAFSGQKITRSNCSLSSISR